MDTLFISDVHLSEDRPEKVDLLIRLLQGPARYANALYILGDLFDSFWLGDDDETPPAPRIVNELRALTQAGISIFFIRGNREFMLGDGFASHTGCTVLDDYHIADLDDKKVLLLHGDRLCIRDIWYQRYRKVIQHPCIRGAFLSLPYGLRRFIVQGLQPLFRKTTDNKPPEIVDVDQDEVVVTMAKYNVKEMIHGHTHRPGIHEFKIDGETVHRTVLNDWYTEDAVLVWRDGKKQLLHVQDYIDSMLASQKASSNPKK